VVVLHEGTLEATLVTKNTTQEEILNFAAGLGASAAKPPNGSSRAAEKRTQP